MRAREVETEEREQEKRLNTLTPTNAGRNGSRPAYDRAFRVGREQRTYNPESDPSGRQFLADVARHFVLGGVMASDRLARHMREESVERPQYASRAAGTPRLLTGRV